MPIRARNGKLEWRFEVNGHEYSRITDLADTERNRIKAQGLEAAARTLVLDGRGAELRLQVQPFNNAADAFKKWSEGEYSDHPNSWKRLAVSMTGAKLFFGKRPKESRGLDDLRDLAILMLNQGCRPEELRELQQPDVDLERGYLTIRKGKSAAARRSLPLTAASRDVLRQRLQQPTRWVFPSPKNPGKHIGQSQRLLAAALNKAQVSFVLYDCRHTFATRAVERGMELPKLMAILGHSNLRSIMKYVHMTQVHIDDGMRKFEAGTPQGEQTKPKTHKRVQ